MLKIIKKNNALHIKTNIYIIKKRFSNYFNVIY